MGLDVFSRSGESQLLVLRWLWSQKKARQPLNCLEIFYFPRPFSIVSSLLISPSLSLALGTVPSFLFRIFTGNVIIYLPETFSGVLRAESTKGEIKFLPALARGMRLLKSTEREQMATLGEGQGDLCEVFTRSGRIVLGLAGRDDYKEEPGFWKKLFA